MELGRARPRLYEYIRASAAAILSVVERVLNLELLDRIRRGNRQPAATEISSLGHIGAVAVCIHAVHHEVVVATTRTIRANLLAPGAQLCCIHHIRIRPSRQTEDLRVIAIHEWQGHNCSFIDYASECDALGLEQRRFDLDFFCDALYRKFYGNPPHFANLNSYVAQHEWRKARCIHG